MKAMVLEQSRGPLRLRKLPRPICGPGDVLIRVHACAVCRTDLHIVDGELPDAKLPLILGHEIVGVIEETGSRVPRIRRGERVGVPWLGFTCGVCGFCRSGEENLCDQACFTGYQRDGGYAEYCRADARFCFPLPPGYSDTELAPFLCAGLIGYRSLRMAGNAGRLGFYGFGAAAHLLIQIAVHQGRAVFVFTRPGDTARQEFARRLGARWAGDCDQRPPEPLDAALIFAPAGELVPLALRSVRKGGVVICAGIHMSDIPSFPYRWLWEERAVRSVANLTRRDGEEFFALARHIRIVPEVQPYPLADANRALEDLRAGNVRGVAVLVVRPPI